MIDEDCGDSKQLEANASTDFLSTRSFCMRCLLSSQRYISELLLLCIRVFLPFLLLEVVNLESRSHSVTHEDTLQPYSFFLTTTTVCSSTLPPSQSSFLSPPAACDIPHLRDSRVASLSSSLLQSNPSPTHSFFFCFEVWLSGDEKQLLVWSLHPPPAPVQFITCLFDCISPFCCACAALPLPCTSPLYIEGRESEIARRSNELFKQNANGLLMDPHFFSPLFFFFPWLRLVAAWQSAV